MIECWMVGCSDGIQDSAIAWTNRMGYRVGGIRSRYRKGDESVSVDFIIRLERCAGLCA